MLQSVSVLFMVLYPESDRVEDQLDRVIEHKSVSREVHHVYYLPNSTILRLKGSVKNNLWILPRFLKYMCIDQQISYIILVDL